jgi:hypothetical protein
LSKTVTSISVDQDVWKAARKFAIDKGITVSELLEVSLRGFMENPREDLLQQAVVSVAENRSGAASKAWQSRRSRPKKR